MESWEVLKQAIEPIGAKAAAAKLKVSVALVYKWCQAPAVDAASPASGARNPLDRVRALFELTRDGRVVNWLCYHADGFFVPNKHVHPAAADVSLLSTTQLMVHNFGKMLADISASVEDNGAISQTEAARIRASWEELKAHAESFVVACEQGAYGTASTSDAADA